MIGRRVIGTVAGLGFTGATISAIEKLGHWITGAPSDPTQATVPMMLWVLAAWTIGPAVGGFIGVGISRWAGSAWIAAALVILGVVATVMSIPTSWWMAAGGIVLPLVAAWVVSGAAKFQPSPGSTGTLT